MFRLIVSRLSRHHSPVERYAGGHRKPARLRLTAVTAVIAAVVGLSVWIAVDEGAASGAAGTGTLTKTGKDLTTGSTDTVTGGDTARYVLSATNDSGSAAPVDISDRFGPGQTLVPGSVTAPPGYTIDTASGVDVHGTAVPGSKGAVAPVPPASGSIQTSVSYGDGFQAIFYNGRVYNVHHHTDGNQRMIDCHIQATGAACPLAGDPTKTWPSGGLSALQTPGSALVAAPTPTTYSTSNSPFAYLSPAGKLYVPVAILNAADSGLACIDLITETSCGYTHVYTPQHATTLSYTTAGQNIGGGATAGTKFYLVGDTGQLFCEQMSGASPVPCAGTWPVQVITPTPPPSSANPSLGQVRTFDGGAHIYVSFPGQLPGCLDTASGTACASFRPPPTYFAPAGTQLLPILDTSGAQVGICQASGAPGGGSCWNTSGATVSSPFPTAGTLGVAHQVWGWNHGGTPAVVGTRVYYTAAITDAAGTAVGERYVCHDFTEAAGTMCSGFNSVLMPSGPLGSDRAPENFPLRAYTLTADPQAPSCIWEIGDRGIIDVLDAGTGASGFSGGSVPGCTPGRTGAQVTVTPGSFYCDGGTSHFQSYDQLSLTGVPSGTAFSGTVTLSNGASIVDTIPVTQASFPLDLSKYSTPSLTARLDVQVKGWPTTGAGLRLTYKGDAPQVCFQVKVADNCDKAVASLDDTATLTVAGVQAAVQKYSFATFNSAGSCPVPHLHYKKTANVTSAKPGEDVTYTIDVTNDGSASTTASFTDDLANILQNATFKSVSAGTVVNNILTWSGPLAPDAHADITLVVTVKAGAPAGAQLPNTVVDATPAVGSNCEPGSRDADCSVTVSVGSAPKLAYTKAATVSSAKPGDTVSYTVTVKNTGNTAIPAAAFTDDLSTMKPNAAIVPSSVTASSGAASVNGDVLSWKGDLATGASATITYHVLISSSAPGATKLPNTVVDATSGVDSNCEQGSSDAACTWTVTVGSAPQLKYTKTSSSPSAKPGETVMYTITVQNTGNVTTDAAYTDDLSRTFTYADLVPNSVTTSAGTTAKIVGSTLSGTATLTQGATATVTFKVTVHADAQGGQSWQNTVIDTTPPTTPSNCKQSQTQPDCTVTVSVGNAPALQYEKTASTSSPRPGDTVDYRIHLTNVGNVDLPQVSFHDSLTDVLAHATLVASSVKPAAASVSAQNVLTWSGALAKGASVDITYQVTVKPGVAAGTKLHNVVVDDTANMPSNCKVASTDPNCPVTVTVAAQPSLAFIKTANVSAAKPGDTVTYSVVVTNTGNSTIAAASFSDDLTTVLQHASFESVVAPASGASFDSATRVLTWKGVLTAGQSVTVKYAVKVAADAPAGSVLRNGVANSTAGVPSNCDPKSTDPQCDSSPTVSPVPHLDLVKKASVSSAHPGDVVVYTITVRNTGNSTIDPASFTDDLSSVLSQSTLDDKSVRASAGTVAIAAGRLSWSGALTQGTSATITYRVKVKANAVAAKGLRNVVVNATSGTPSDCDAGSHDPKCAVILPVVVPPRSSVLPESESHAPNSIDTGLGAHKQASGPGVLTVTLGGLLVLVGSGALLLGAGRRRRRRA